jgi:hypothetical protein
MFPGRGISIKGVMYTRMVNGRPVAARWPTGQTTPRTKAQKKNLDLIAQAARATTYMSAGAQAFSRDLAKQTKLAPRDFLMISLFNRVGYLVRENGIKVYSMAAKQDVSNLLDTIAQHPGSLMLRGQTWWDPLEPGDPGMVLGIDAGGNVMWLEIGTAGEAIEWKQMPYLIPTAAGSWLGSNAFTGRPIYCPAGVSVSGVRCMLKSTVNPQTANPGLYRANPAGLGLAGGARLAVGTPTALAVGFNEFPFTAPYTPASDEWLYAGLNLQGGGDVTFMNANLALGGSFFTTASNTLPNPAPSGGSGAAAALTFWCY